MELEIVETVLNDMLEEQKTGNQLNRELIENVKVLAGKVEGFDEKLTHQKVIAQPADTKPLEKIVTDGVADISRIVESQPKNVIKQVRLLLFPETNAGQYYKIVFGRLMPWALGLILATYGFNLGQTFIERWSVNSEREQQSDQVLQAWKYLYDHEKAEGKKKMQDALGKTWNGGR
jgi:hypothetical protein